MADRTDTPSRIQFSGQLDEHQLVPGSVRLRELNRPRPHEGPRGRRKGPDPRKLPGLVKYSNISLKWGITNDADIWKWR